MRIVKTTAAAFGAELDCLAVLGEVVAGCVSAEEIETWTAEARPSEDRSAEDRAAGDSTAGTAPAR